MVTNMREMKDSGIDWVGSIPKEWDFIRGKYHLSNKKYIPGIHADKYERLSLTLQGVLPRSKDDTDGLQPKDFYTYQLLRKGELVFKLIDLQNVSTSRVGLSHDIGLVSPAYIVLHSDNEISTEYLQYFYLMMWHKEIFNALGDNGVRSNLSATDLLNVRIPVPSLVEQYKIADFLNSKCTEIDSLRSDIEKEIEILEEYKKSIISETVTKGLDKNVEMKDSGIDWVGEIPKNWDIYKNKMLLSSIYSGGTPTSSNPEYYDVDGIPFITIADMSQTDYVSTTKIGLTKKGILNKSLKILPPGTILYSIYATLGAVSETTIPATINQAILALTPKEEICYKKYYKYNLIALKDYIFSLSNKTTQSNLNAEIVKNLNIVVPPFDIQKKIADYLDSKCSDIDSIIEDKKKQLKILETHKKSIIYEYVTGKKEVSA